MTQLDDRPGSQTDPASRFPDIDELEARFERRSAGRIVAIVALLAGVMLVTAVVGYTLAGGRWPGRAQSAAQAPATAAPTTPAPQMAAAAAVVATAAATNTAVPAKPTAPPPTPLPPTPAPPTPAPPTPLPPTAAPSAPTAAAKPAQAPVASQPGVGIRVRPGVDARQAQIEGRVREYFQALGNEDYARAQEVCCTAEWRARYPLEQWRRNFSGVSDLQLVGSPRYLDQSDEQVVVDTDYTFESGGARRNFTLRWTFRPVGSEWQADLAEAFPTE